MDIEPTRIRKAAFVAIIVFVVAISIEAAAQLLYLLGQGHLVFAWSGQEVFRARTFNRLVPDARHATTVADFSDPNYGGYGISIDSYGFRRGSQHTDPKCPSVVFIGDSVPFGWGVADHSSMPSKFFEALQKAKDPRCVINAAIPSYSLFQAVARFEMEILNRFNVDSVVLQVYDPVTQFVRFGPQWKPNMDWITEPASVWEPKQEYVATLVIMRSALRRFGVLKTTEELKKDERLKPMDQGALGVFRLEIRKELQRFHDLVRQASARRLVLAPVTVPVTGYNELPQQYRIAIDVLNDELKRLAEKNADTTFLDTIRLFRSRPENEMFIDKCCHLSERGNELQAAELAAVLQ